MGMTGSVLGVTHYKVQRYCNHITFPVMSSVRHYWSECSNHITVCQARSLRYIASRTHHTQRLGMGIHRCLIGAGPYVDVAATLE